MLQIQHRHSGNRISVCNRYAAGEAEWTPNSISGCKFWLRSDLGISVSVGSSIPTWNDQSSSGWNVSQALAGAQPVLSAGQAGGYNGVAFTSASSQYLTASQGVVSLAQPATVFIVCSSITDSKAMMDGLNAAGRWYYGHFLNAAGKDELYAGTSFAAVNWALAAGFHMHAVNVNGASTQLWVDNNAKSVAANAGAWPLTGLAIATRSTRSANFLNGAIMEMIFYNSVLGATDEATVTEYLRARYSLW